MAKLPDTQPFGPLILGQEQCFWYAHIHLLLQETKDQTLAQITKRAVASVFHCVSCHVVGCTKIMNCCCLCLRQSDLCIAFVNLKPLVPGHVLVVPRRVVPRYSGLTPEEAKDLWEGVLAVQRILAKARRERPAGAAATGPGECAARAPSHGPEYEHELEFTIGMQDGPIAGQSVPHVHVHILPS